MTLIGWHTQFAGRSRPGKGKRDPKVEVEAEHFRLQTVSPVALFPPVSPFSLESGIRYAEEVSDDFASVPPTRCRSVSSRWEQPPWSRPTARSLVLPS